MIPLVEQAERLARHAHADARNKHNGEPYIKHVERVAGHLIKMHADPDVVAVAWMHDLVEDTRFTLQDLAELRFPLHVVRAVDAITHRKGEPRLDYYRRVGQDRLALAAKLSDIRDNTDPARRCELPEATRIRLDQKYQIAHRELIPWLIHHLKEN